MRMISGLVMLVLLHHVEVAWANAHEWELIRTGGGETSFRAVAIHPTHEEWIFALTNNTLYESRDNGKTWQERFHLPAQAVASDIAVDSSEKSTLLLATDRGLYGSSDGGDHWSLLFRGASGAAAACTYVAFHPARHSTAILGTHKGLFVSSDNGQRWKELGIPPAARDVSSVAFHPQDPDRLYLVTSQGLFVGSLTNGSWQQRVSVLQAEETTDAPAASDVVERGDTDVPLQHLSAVALDPHEPATLYLGSSRGLRMSTDDGISWQVLPHSGLESREITRLLLQRHSPVVIYAATARGVARYEPERERWVVATQGLATGRVHDLATTQTHLWAATDRGLYRFQVAPEAFTESEPPSAEELLANFTYEPTIAQVRDAAIRYAEVHPAKIASWRTQARLRAIVPKIMMTADSNLTDFRHWDSGTNPDSLLRGERDIDWATNITWELGDLIWSDDQTSIDVRSKLMVELRNDLLDDVTRTYFERRRLQVALLTSPPSDQQTLLDKELRVQELTALIDGLTGGYFSKQMKVHSH